MAEPSRKSWAEWEAFFAKQGCYFCGERVTLEQASRSSFALPGVWHVECEGGAHAPQTGVGARTAAPRGDVDRRSHRQGDARQARHGRGAADEGS